MFLRQISHFHMRSLFAAEKQGSGIMLETTKIHGPPHSVPSPRLYILFLKMRHLCTRWSYRAINGSFCTDFREATRAARPLWLAARVARARTPDREAILLLECLTAVPFPSTSSHSSFTSTSTSITPITHPPTHIIPITHTPTQTSLHLCPHPSKSHPIPLILHSSLRSVAFRVAFPFLTQPEAHAGLIFITVLTIERVRSPFSRLSILNQLRLGCCTGF